MGRRAFFDGKKQAMAGIKTKLAVTSAAAATIVGVGLAAPAASQAATPSNPAGGIANLVNCAELTVNNLLYATPGQPTCQLGPLVGELLGP
jgi:hypothetical protein